MIDYVITKKRDIRDFKITRSFHASCYLSDHALLRSKTSLCFQRRRVQKSMIPKRINVLPLKNTEIQSTLSRKLDEKSGGVRVLTGGTHLQLVPGVGGLVEVTDHLVLGY